MALDTVLTPELVAEGLARDVVRHVQQLRKDANFEMNDRIHLRYDTDDETLGSAIEAWGAYIKKETLSDTLHRGLLDEPDRVATVGGAELKLSVARA